MLTKSDFHQMRLIIRDEVSTIVKTEIRKQLDEKIGLLPTKDEFYKNMDKWMKAASTKDLEQTSHKNSHDRTNKRLDKIEKHLGLNSY